MAGLGMDAEIMLGVDDNLKKKVGWFAYFVSGIKALRFPTMRVHISVDDGPFHRFRARTVVVGTVGVHLLVDSGHANLHIKPFLLGGVLAGGICCPLPPTVDCVPLSLCTR